ncbi:hypothetical protein D1007_24565 [Hordeum vulgare]|nr:hypothetical protein D1007_24565 [Hordeum vulgare]
MPRPAGVSDTEWRADVLRQEAVTTDWWRRLNAKNIRDAAEAAAAVDQEDASYAGMMNPPGRNPWAAWRGREGIAPATLSRAMLPSGYVPLPIYSDSNTHSGFNPNTTIPHCVPQLSSLTGFSHDPRTPSPAFSTGLNTQYSYSLSAYSSAASPAPSLRRGVLPFVPTLSLQLTTRMPTWTRSSQATPSPPASHSEFGMRDETMDTTDNIDNELDDAEEGE